MKICVDSQAKLAHWQKHLPDIKLGDTINTGRGRYGNVRRRVVDDIKFASDREAERYLELKLLQRAHKIKRLELQPCIPITIGGVEVRIYSKRFHKKGRHMTYIADFRYYDNEKKCTIIEDAKMQSGHRTEVYKIKRALVTAMGLHIEEV